MWAGGETRLAVVQHEVLVEKLRILIRDAARVLPAHVDPPLVALLVDLLVDLLVGLLVDLLVDLPGGGGLDDKKKLISDIWEKWGRHIWGKGRVWVCTWTDAFELVGETRRIPADWKKWRRKWKRDQRLACRDTPNHVWREEWAQRKKRGQHRPHPKKARALRVGEKQTCVKVRRLPAPSLLRRKRTWTSDEVCSTQTGNESDGMGERNA